MVAVPATPPPFVARVERVTAAQLPYSWRPGCPVGPSRLRRVRLRYVGFDGRAHMGELIVSERVTPDVIAVFRTLYRARFPIRQMRPIDVFRGSDSRSTAADNTSAFNCRYAVAPGAKHWSMHAYGEAIDVDTVENPYIQSGRVTPANAAAYADRGDVRPGMAVEGGVLVRAFEAVGWGWGGRWAGSPDYQHFSANGR
ncbi:MAG TPA: M15 family metallopeptidase [Gaiellaceae bacterium]|nr:M15 family metallopeptidase [Gaiellaceae bacterium]